MRQPTKVHVRKFETRPEKASERGGRGDKARADMPETKSTSCGQGDFCVFRSIESLERHTEKSWPATFQDRIARLSETGLCIYLAVVL